jgi:hypothetical protein
MSEIKFQENAPFECNQFHVKKSLRREIIEYGNRQRKHRNHRRVSFFKCLISESGHPPVKPLVLNVCETNDFIVVKGFSFP